MFTFLINQMWNLQVCLYTFAFADFDLDLFSKLNFAGLSWMYFLDLQAQAIKLDTYIQFCWEN